MTDVVVGTIVGSDVDDIFSLRIGSWLVSRVGSVRGGKDGRRAVGWGAGNLWLKSYRLHGAVYDAMVSRGYSGEPVTLERFRPRARDGILLATAILILAGTLWLNRYSK